MNLPTEFSHGRLRLVYWELHLFVPIAAFCVVLNLALDHVNHDLVTDKTSLVHDLLRLSAEIRLLRDLCPQHVTGGLVLLSAGARLVFC